MPKEAARLFLRMTDVRVERLQEMTNDDFVCNFRVCQEAIQAVGRDALAIPFWDSTIKPTDRTFYGWAANPWVWVGAVKVAAYTRYEAMIAAAKLWRTAWTPIARDCVIENLGAVKGAKA